MLRLLMCLCCAQEWQRGDSSGHTIRTRLSIFFILIQYFLLHVIQYQLISSSWVVVFLGLKKRLKLKSGKEIVKLVAACASLIIWRQLHVNNVSMMCLGTTTVEASQHVIHESWVQVVAVRGGYSCACFLEEPWKFHKEHSPRNRIHIIEISSSLQKCMRFLLLVKLKKI